MPIINFVPGELAKASEVNQNFDTIMNLLGGDSTTERMTPDVEYAMGKRNNTLFTGRQDISNAPTERKFFQIGWNADWGYDGTKWRLSRFINGEPSTLIRLGWYGFEVMVTSQTGGNLEGQLEPVFAVRATSGEDYIYIKNSFHIRNVDNANANLGNYRLTYVPLEVPAVIYDGVPLSNQDTTRLATQYGVSTNAKMIRINVEAKAGPDDAYIRFLQNMTPPVGRRYGFTMHAQANKWNSMEGDVPLGEGAFQYMFRIVRVNTFVEAYAYIKGYYV